MVARTTRKTVKFLDPFQITGVEGILPPSSYEVETVEEQLEGLSFEAHRRVSKTITVQGSTGLSRQLATLEPLDLAVAPDKDAEASTGQPQV
jgi:hypothetical protein